MSIPPLLAYSSSGISYFSTLDKSSNSPRDFDGSLSITCMDYEIVGGVSSIQPHPQ